MHMRRWLLLLDNIVSREILIQLWFNKQDIDTKDIQKSHSHKNIVPVGFVQTIIIPWKENNPSLTISNIIKL